MRLFQRLVSRYEEVMFARPGYRWQAVWRMVWGWFQSPKVDLSVPWPLAWGDLFPLDTPEEVSEACSRAYAVAVVGPYQTICIFSLEGFLNSFLEAEVDFEPRPNSTMVIWL
jgi:hypothetical protein